MVTRLSVAIRVWPSACVPVSSPSANCLDELVREPGLLVDLDHVACAHHPQVRSVLADPSLGLGRVGPDDEDRVTRAHTRLARVAERTGERTRDVGPRLTWVGGEEGQLARAVRRRIAVDGDPGAVRPAVGHLLEHRGEMHAQLRLHLGRLREEPDDPAHMFRSYTGPSA